MPLLGPSRAPQLRTIPDGVWRPPLTARFDFFNVAPIAGGCPAILALTRPDERWVDPATGKDRAKVLAPRHAHKRENPAICGAFLSLLG